MLQLRDSANWCGLWRRSEIEDDVRVPFKLPARFVDLVTERHHFDQHASLRYFPEDESSGGIGDRHRRHAVQHSH
jgi:hypothetical protein